MTRILRIYTDKNENIEENDLIHWDLLKFSIYLGPTFNFLSVNIRKISVISVPLF